VEFAFLKEHLSISKFNTFSTPDLLVLTGVNGSGKSHFLEAISKNKVAINGEKDCNISLFNYETFRLDNERNYNLHAIQQEKENAWQHFNKRIKNRAANLKSQTIGSYYSKGTSNIPEGSKLLNYSNEKVYKYRDEIEKLFLSETQSTPSPHLAGIVRLANDISFPIDEIEQEDFLDLYRGSPLKNNFLPSQLGQIFWDYYVRERENSLRLFENKEYGFDYAVLSQDEFETKYGPPPWTLINRILSNFGSLRYKVKTPNGASLTSNFKMSLVHLDKDIEIDFADLSSGEKILMALVASVYKTSSDTLFPNVLLLDEVDASLHPSMMKNMLNVIQNVFLENGTKVVLVTHSPTTIALSPDESIFVMSPSGEDRIQHKSKSEALAILTEGFATIEQGLTLFDQSKMNQITIITEGRNSEIIEKLLELYEIDFASVLTGCENISGTNQLRTLFDFFSNTKHESEVLFIWDCDYATTDLTACNKTTPFTIPKNNENQLAKRGIENAFSEEMFEGFVTTSVTSTGCEHKNFDSSRKKDFARHIVDNASKKDFENFSQVIDMLHRLKESSKIET